MRCPQLNDLPEPPPGKKGWPWTEESTPLPSPDAQRLPRITVVTPSFNQGTFLEETIRSVLLQGYPDLEYIVLDGGSTDGSLEVIKKYSRWLTYWVSEPDGGQSNAINRGVTMSSGLFATWINSDDMLCKDALCQHTCRIGFEPNTVYVGTCLYIDEFGNILSSHRGRVHSLDDLVRIRKVWRGEPERGHIVQPEVLFPRDLMLAVGGLDVNNHSTMDYELWGKFLISGAQFRYTDIQFGLFREHPKQKIRDGLRQTNSLLNTAAKLVLQADCFSEEMKSELLADLRSYGETYENDYWKATGRLARLGLPRQIVLAFRRLRGVFQNEKNARSLPSGKKSAKAAQFS